MKANKEEAMAQAKSILKKTKGQIAQAKNETDRAVGRAVCEAYLQAFFFCGVISREEYFALRKEIRDFCRMDGYWRKIKGKGA